MSGSDQRAAAGVGGWRERPAAPLTRPLSASRVPPTNSLTLTPSPTRPASRVPPTNSLTPTPSLTQPATRDPLSASRLAPATVPAAADLLAHTDLLISGPYVAAARSIERPWVGSDNQQVHLLSARYQGHSDLAARRAQSVHVQLLDGDLRVTGWPGAIGGVRIRRPVRPTDEGKS